MSETTCMSVEGMLRFLELVPDIKVKVSELQLELIGTAETTVWVWSPDSLMFCILRHIETVL